MKYEAWGGQEARFLMMRAPEVSVQSWSCQHPAIKMIPDIEKVEIGARSLEAGGPEARMWPQGWRATNPGTLMHSHRPACPRSPGGPLAQYINRYIYIYIYI